MDKHYQNWTTAYIESIRESRDRQDEALVAKHRQIVSQIVGKLEDKMHDALIRGNEKDIAMVNQIAGLVGLGITQKKQAKDKTFSYKLKK